MNYKDVPIVPSGMIAMMQNMDDEIGGPSKGFGGPSLIFYESKNEN